MNDNYEGGMLEFIVPLDVAKKAHKWAGTLKGYKIKTKWEKS
jgi:hypothetical protein